jgi:enterochelin esterase-like enzyme
VQDGQHCVHNRQRCTEHGIIAPMLRLLCLSIAILAFLLNGQASASELRFEKVASKALGRDMPIAVYLPDGYEKGQQLYPVLYLLHGAGGNEHSWADRGHIKEKADALIATRAIPPAIIVMPACPACWWIDGAKDKAETAFWMDLVPAIDARYRTIETRGGLLIAGLSAGGYGAIRFAMLHPDRVAAVAALSPAVYAGAVPVNSAARIQPPFLGPDGRFDQSAWDAHNYPRLIDHYFAQPFRVPFYLVAGDGDRFGIAYETALLFKRIFERQPDQVEFRVVDGEHSWKVWESTIEDAIRYIFRYADPPHPLTRTARAPVAVVSSNH